MTSSIYVRQLPQYRLLTHTTKLSPLLGSGSTTTTTTTPSSSSSSSSCSRHNISFGQIVRHRSIPPTVAWLGSALEHSGVGGICWGGHAVVTLKQMRDRCHLAPAMANRRMTAAATAPPVVEPGGAGKLHRGLEGVVAATSAISTVGLNGTGLNYRGYAIKDLTDNCGFEEVAYLLLYGTLPTHSQLNLIKTLLIASRRLPDSLKAVLELLPKDTNPMDVLRTAVSMLGCLQPELPDKLSVQQVATNLIGKYASILCYWYTYSHKGIRIDTMGVDRDSVASHFLRLLHQTGDGQVCHNLMLCV
eukprot:GHVQ01011522.1.p1 GENE.GHVQ01011522.1~~GHVQ01011522.1.p1  ORF type:complete len:303 (+),score=59.56 GHVQ01011522.1:541-1449(+)